jgi:glycerophosphoryl diester phosphodiesterase
MHVLVTAPRRAIAAAACVVLAVLTAPVATADTPAPPTGVQLVAHAGSSANAPENTLVAFDRAVAEHADRISIDVGLTRDGVPVVLHDSTLKRTTDARTKFPSRAPWSVGSFTLAEVKTLDAGSWFVGGAFTGTAVPTLDETLTELSSSPVGLTIEIKNPASHGGVAGIGDAVMKVLGEHQEWASQTHDVAPRAIIESFDWTFLDDLHNAYPDQPLMLVGTVANSDVQQHPYVPEVDAAWSLVDHDTVAAMQATGVRVGVWTPDTAAELTTVLALGVELVTTNQVERLRDLLASTGRTWSGIQWPGTSPVSLTLDAPSTGGASTHVPLTARALDGDGHVIPWQVVDLQQLEGRVWRTIAKSATGSRGVVSMRPRLPDAPTSWRVVAPGLASTARVVVPRATVVASPPRAPQPRLRLPAQSRTGPAGARAVVTPLSAARWSATLGTSRAAGCPVGRSDLRSVTSSYWGFDGYRHRGTVVVSAHSAHRLARVLTRLYERQLPIRALRRVEDLGSYRSATTRALASDATFGFTCHRMPQDTTRFGSHSRGRVVTLNPWENPTKVRTGGSPDSWWLNRSLPGVHTRASAVVRAFAAEGFTWAGGRGRYGDFRDVR